MFRGAGVTKERVLRRLATILAADVVGYSRLMGQDEEATLATLKSYREVIDGLVAGHDGRVFGSAGDSVIAEFASPVEAVRSAKEIHLAIEKRNAKLPEAHRMRFRIGINLGDVMVERDNLLGDGVNIASRLEGLADPGGICVSGAVHEQVRDRIDFPFEDLGEREVKNIDRPVRVWRWVADPLASIGTHARTDRQLALPDQPSIAVLPFDNMSGDPDQEYFADGMVEEITAALSRVRSFFVVARNSSFAFKGKSIDARQVSRQLGVRYVLEGSVRKSGNRVRITAQLIDGANDRHVWADRYDGTLDDIFDLQDQVAESVVGQIEPELRSSEIERSRRKPTNDLNAYDCFLRALPHANAMTREDNEEALRLTSEAITLDHDYAAAMGLASWCYTLRIPQGWVEHPQAEAKEALRLARAAVKNGKNQPETLWLAGYALGFFGGSAQEGIDLIDDALRLNPNAAQALVYGGWLRVYDGNAETAKAHFERALRLSPLDPNAYRTYAGLAFCCLFLDQLDEAISWANKAIHQNPNFTPTHRVLAACLAHRGRLTEAREVAARLQALVPSLTVTRYRKETRFRYPEYVDFLLDGLRKSGLPE